ncbi:MAG: NAD(P)H-quinone oxidoreductase [Clostridia bacterium]|nr:NAD(P)H-quinone oxidoreductase [Clostridia bacterium]
MKAIVIQPDTSLRWQDVPDPVPAAGEVCIAVYAAALNRADLLQREGKYPPPPGCPEWPGLEAAGVICALSPEAEAEGKWKVGDRVCALLGGGGYAQYVTVPACMCMPIPKGLTMAEGAALPEAFATAWLNLCRIGEAKEGETLLMHAGGSGLASAVVPLAKSMGMRVITTVRGAAKAELVRYLNADRIIDLTTESMADALREEEAAGHPVNIAIDCLGGDMLGESLPYVARGCRWIVIATLAGDISPVDFRNVYVKNIRIIGSTLRSKSPEEKGAILTELTEQVWPKIETGEIPLKIHAVLPITEAERAQEMLYRGENIGKVVLQVQDQME